MDEIRSARSEDAPRVAQLAGDLGYTISSASVGTAIDRLQADEGAIFVADEGERVTGWIHVRRSHVIQTEPFAEVGGLVVDPQNRGDGIGRRLLETAEQWASANGLSVIRVRSNIVRSNAHLFYERRGYNVEKTSYTFTKNLNAD
ncbi:MAG: GNAT family N-acetyltransferase [Acidimicrobiia bacterium]|jgi:GNAT superfamily N-acetyltransferase